MYNNLNCLYDRREGRASVLQLILLQINVQHIKGSFYIKNEVLQISTIFWQNFYIEIG